MRELFTRLEGTVGFYMKVVERAGRRLQNLFPLITLWDGIPFGRELDCVNATREQRTFQTAPNSPFCMRMYAQFVC